MEKTPPTDSAQAVQDKQQQQIEVTDLTVHYTLEHSSVTLPAVLAGLLTLAVLFRLNSANKWHAVLRQKLLPEPLLTWLDIKDLAIHAARMQADPQRTRSRGTRRGRRRSTAAYRKHRSMQAGCVVARAAGGRRFCC